MIVGEGLGRLKAAILSCDEETADIAGGDGEYARNECLMVGRKFSSGGIGVAPEDTTS